MMGDSIAINDFDLDGASVENFEQLDTEGKDTDFIHSNPLKHHGRK